MKRLLTYLSAIIIMMMVPIGMQAVNDIYLIGTTLNGNNWDAKGSHKFTYDSGTNQATLTLPAATLSGGTDNNTVYLALWIDQGGTSGYRLRPYSTTELAFGSGSVEVKSDYSEWSSSSVQLNSVSNSSDKEYVITLSNCAFSGDDWVSCDVSVVENTIPTTTATLTIGGTDITGTNTGSNYYFTIPAASYTAGTTMTFNLKTETSGTATYYTGDFTGTGTGDAFTYSTSSSSATMSYTVPSDATGAITVSLLTGTNQVTFAYGGSTSTGYYLIGDLNCFGRPYTDTSWTTQDWTTYGAVNKVMQFHDNGDGTYSLRIPASRSSSDDSTWDKPENEKGTGTSKFVIAPEAAFSGIEYSEDLFSVSNWNNWSGLTLDWSQVLRPQDNSSLNNAAIASGTMVATGGDNSWTVYNNGGSYTITINPTAGTFSVTNDNTTHVMYVITKQDGYWRNSYLTDVTSDQGTAYNHRHGDNTSTGELSEFPNLAGETVYIAHNWHEQGSNKNFTTNQHLNIFGAWNSNGDLAPVTWIAAKSGATAKSIFPTAGNYSTNIDPTTGRTDGVDGANQYSSVISSNNDPSTGNITGKKGDEALIDPDATLTPGTTTWDSYTLNEAKTLTVTLNNDATAYKYSYGAGTTPSTLGTSTTFGNLSYDGTDVKLGSTTVAAGTNTVTICIQGTDGANDGAVHEYTYTFNPTVVTTLDFTPKGGLFINSAKITVTGGTAPYTYTVKDASGNVRSTGYFVLGDNDPEDNYRISTPGYLTVTDALGNTATSTELFDFTYSTSENYKNYTNNATISKTVQTGGGEGALNVFMQVDETLETLWLYAYNKTLDAEWKAQHGNPGDEATEEAKKAKQAALDKEVRLTSAFPGDNIKDADQINIDGIKFVHFTIPEDNLREGDKVAIIVSQGTTAEQNWWTQTTDNGIEIERTSDPAFIYVVKNKPADTPSDAGSHKGENYIVQLVEDGTRTIFFKMPSGWTAPVYCHAWTEGHTGQTDGLEWQSSGERMTLHDTANNIYTYNVPAGMDKVMFSYSGGKTPEGGIAYPGGRKHYTFDGTTLSEADATGDEAVADLDELTTFLTTPPTTTVVTNKYPNGEDYWRAAPGDLSIKLDPTWGGKTFIEETSIVDWAGTAVPKHIVPEQMPLTQTIQGLNAGKTYTVQAIVRGLGQQGKTVTLTLEGATTVSKTLNLRNGSGGSEKVSDLGRQGNEVTKTGRIEYIEPLNLAGMNKHTGTDAAGWAKVEATVKASQAGWLTISLTGDEWFNLSQVTLLEDANTDHGFRTTASTSAIDTDLANVDFRDRSWKKNNAFSFFDRGKNRNAVVFADKRTVIAMDDDLLAASAEGKGVERRHPFNVVATNGATDTNGEASVLYLTDMGYGNDKNNPIDHQIGENNADWGEEYNTTDYRKSGYTFKPTLPFTASKVVMDRPIGNETKRQTTIMLPFAISQSELQTYYGNALEVWSYASYNTDERKIVFTRLTGDLAANTPYILTGAVNPNTGGTAILDSRNNASSTAKTIPAVTSTIYATAENHSGFTGTYEFQTIERGDANETRYGFNPSTGKFQIASYSGAALKPFRAYFTLPLPYEAQTSAPAYTVVFDDTITGISDTIQVEVEPTDVYTLGGVRVATKGDLSRLPKGVYIVNGKKVIK